MTFTRVTVFSLALSLASPLLAREPVNIDIAVENPDEARKAYQTHLTPQVRAAFEALCPEKPKILEIVLKIREKNYRFGQLYMDVIVERNGRKFEYLFSPEGKLWAFHEKLKLAETPPVVRATLEQKKLKRDAVWKWTINHVVHYEAPLQHVSGDTLSIIAVDGTYLGEKLSGNWAEPK